jgi:hypothetical protein
MTEVDVDKIKCKITNLHYEIVYAYENAVEILNKEDCMSDSESDVEIDVDEAFEEYDNCLEQNVNHIAALEKSVVTSVLYNCTILPKDIAKLAAQYSHSKINKSKEKSDYNKVFDYFFDHGLDERINNNINDNEMTN